MESLSFIVKINKEGKSDARAGIELSKLSQISGHLITFLESLTNEMGIKIDSSKWVAKKFKNSSVLFEVENLEKVEAPKKRTFNETFRKVVRSQSSRNISLQTFRSYHQITEILDYNDTIKFGIEDGNDNKLEWYELKKAESELLVRQEESTIEVMEKPIERRRYYGGIRGRIHDWHILDERYIKVRREPEGDLIWCYYPEHMYEEIQSKTDKENRLISITGYIQIEPDGKIYRIDITDVDRVEEYRDGDLEKFLGCAKGLTGGLTTEDYISMGHDNGE